MSLLSLLLLGVNVRKSTKISVLFFIVLLCCSAIGAASLSFDLNPPSPLYRPYLADPFNTDLAVGYVFLFSSEDRPAHLYKVTEGSSGIEYNGLDINQYYTSGTNMIMMRGGSSLPVARITLGPLAVETNIRGGFRAFFFAYSGTDLLGFDGTYYIGMNAKLGNFLTFSFGRKHHSGHIGDEIIAIIDKKHPVNGSLLNDRQIDYVRQDPLTFALSLNVIRNFRLYGELRLGDTGRILKPNFSSADSIADGYRAREFEMGAELSFPVPYVGDFTVAFDMTFHEMGKFKPQGSGDIVNGESEKYSFIYDKTAPWETEFQVVLAQSLTQREEGLRARIMVTYHYGRFPLFAFHMSKGSFISVGGAMSF